MPESKHRRRPRRNPSSHSGSRASSAPSGGGPVRPAFAARKRKTNWWYLSISAAIAFLVIGGFVISDVTSALGRRIGAGSANAYVEGVGEQQEVMPTRNHLPDGQAVTYNSDPPTSGDHWTFPVSCGFYEEGIPNEQVVHNLEHSNIIVSYNLTDPAQVQQLKDAINDIGKTRIWGVTRFYQSEGVPPGTVALSAWGVLDKMEGVDKERIKKFFDTYAGNLGPEGGIPCEGPQQGMTQPGS